MKYIVVKFGGTSVSSCETWEKIHEITQQHLKAGLKPVIVCSALSQISNKLEQASDAALLNQHGQLLQDIIQSYHALAADLAVSATLITHEIQALEQWLTGIALLKEASPKIRAQILSLGELMLTRLGHKFLVEKGLRCHWFDVRDALTSTAMAGSGHEVSNYLAACCHSTKNQALIDTFANLNTEVILTQGFFVKSPEGETVLLGRGGSDTSAALLAIALDACACEIWTDVPGIYTANPHQLPHARLLKQLHYNEAQEIASMGAKVLHPNCIPPVRQANIPMMVKYTRMPQHSGTRISFEKDDNAPPIKSIQVKHSIILISIDTLSMWQQVGFLADIFLTFKEHGFSVDLLSSSEFNVTVSLDNNAKIQDKKALNSLLDCLNQHGRAKLIEPCSAVSLVGHHIRTVLPKLGPALEVFEAKQIHLMSLASNDLNLTFVVDASHAEKLCQQLHTLLIENSSQRFYFSKSWHEEFGTPEPKPVLWWETKRADLLKLAEQSSPCYVYDLQTQAQKAQALVNLKAIDTVFYAVKANAHPDILQNLYNQGLGFECVSIQELQHILTLFPDIDRTRVLFTPNFAAKKEYEYALSIGCFLTIDNLHPLEHWPDLLKHQKIFLRIDPGSGAGHHKFVSTAGNESKFGIPRADLSHVCQLLDKHRIQVIGLHAHSGSGILKTDLWQETARLLTELLPIFPEVRIINLGGGLGVVEKPGQTPINLLALDTALSSIKSQFSNLAFWLEPGRFCVADSGVILAKVTQCKQKGRTRFIGIETGMNSLIRPALYGAYHEIINLTRFYDDHHYFSHIVGPICESGDTLGYDRLMPTTYEGDILLIANAGAYGFCMSSHYNLRPPATECILD